MVLAKNSIEQKDLEYILIKTAAEFEILGGNTLFFTGANGFLGYYFIKSILAWNDLNPKKRITIYALDTFTSNIPAWLTQREEIKIIKNDVTVYQLPADLDFNYIVHAASIASPTFYRKYPIETINANVQGLYNILNYMVKKLESKQKVKGLLFFSSSEIYGDPTEGNIPTPETYRGNVSCTGPRACYDESKRFCETLCVNYAKVYDLPIKTARPFNNYGPGLKITDGRVIPDFANNILSNKDIVLFSKGSSTRTFCYIADALVGYIKILAKGRPAEAYNIGIEKPEISMLDLAEKMKNIALKHFDYSGKVVRQKSNDQEYLTDNPSRRCPQIAKAKNELQYTPEISLDEGLTNTLLWYKATL